MLRRGAAIVTLALSWAAAGLHPASAGSESPLFRAQMGTLQELRACREACPVLPSMPYWFYASLDQMDRDELKREIDRAAKRDVVGQRPDLLVERAKILRAGLNREGALRELVKILDGSVSARRALRDEAHLQEAEIRLELATQELSWADAFPVRAILFEYITQGQPGDDAQSRLDQFARSRAVPLDASVPERNSAPELLRELALASFLSTLAEETPPGDKRRLTLLAFLAEKTAARHVDFPENRWSLLHASFYARMLANSGLSRNEYVDESWRLYRDALRAEPTIDEVSSGRFDDRDFEVFTTPSAFFDVEKSTGRLPDPTDPEDMTRYLQNLILAEILFGQPYQGRRGRDTELGAAIVRLGPPDQVSIHPEVGEAIDVGTVPEVSGLGGGAGQAPILGLAKKGITFSWGNQGIEAEMLPGGRMAARTEPPRRTSAEDVQAEASFRNAESNRVDLAVTAYDDPEPSAQATALAWGVPSEITTLDADGRLHARFQVALVPPEGDVSWGQGRWVDLSIVERAQAPEGGVVHREVFRTQTILHPRADVRTLPTGESFYVVSHELRDAAPGAEYQLVAGYEARWPETEGQTFAGEHRFLVDALSDEMFGLGDARMFVAPPSIAPEQIIGLSEELLVENPLFRVAQGSPFLVEIPFQGAKPRDDASFDLAASERIFATSTFEDRVAAGFRARRERGDAVDLRDGEFAASAVQLPPGGLFATLVPPIEPLGVYVEKRKPGRGKIRVLVTTGGLTPGSYVLMVQLEDRNAGEIAHLRLDFGVTPEGALLSAPPAP